MSLPSSLDATLPYLPSLGSSSSVLGSPSPVYLSGIFNKGLLCYLQSFSGFLWQLLPSDGTLSFPPGSIVVYEKSHISDAQPSSSGAFFQIFFISSDSAPDFQDLSSLSALSGRCDLVCLTILFLLSARLQTLPPNSLSLSYCDTNERLLQEHISSFLSTAQVCFHASSGDSRGLYIKCSSPIEAEELWTGLLKHQGIFSGLHIPVDLKDSLRPKQHHISFSSLPAPLARFYARALFRSVAKSIKRQVGKTISYRHGLCDQPFPTIGTRVKPEAGCRRDTPNIIELARTIINLTVRNKYKARSETFSEENGPTKAIDSCEISVTPIEREVSVKSSGETESKEAADASLVAGVHQPDKVIGDSIITYPQERQESEHGSSSRSSSMSSFSHASTVED